MSNQNNHNPTLQNKKNNHVIVHQEQTTQFSGPIPPPEIIERYETVYPGAAKIIFEDWDRQVRHRHELESKLVSTDNIKSLLGVVFGFIIQAGAIIAGIYTALQGLIAFGVLIVLGGFLLLLIAFITNRAGKDQKKDD